LPDVNHLIVPDDSRVPKFAFESSGRGEDDDLLVVFEDGTIGSLGDPEKSYLRSGSSYTMMFRNVKDILTKPEFEEGTIDSQELLGRYYRSQVPIFAVSILTVLLPLYDGDLSFSSLEFGFLFFPVAVAICFYPEITLYLAMSKETPSKIRLNLEEEEENVIELLLIGPVSRASRGSKTVGRGVRLALTIMIVTKFALPISTVEAALGFENLAIGYLFFFLLVLPITAFRGWLELRREPSEGEVKVEHATARKVHDFIRKKWLKSSLDGLLKLKGESKNLEFKSSLWYDYKKANPDSKRYNAKYDHTNKKEWGSNNQMMSMNVVKTVAGFLNAGISGTVLIGVDDDCKVLGLEKDFQLLVDDKDPEDDFTRKLEDILFKKMETDGTLNGKWNISWLGEEKRVCRLDTVPQMEAAVWTITEKAKIYYLRRSNATVKVDPGSELSKELKKFNQ
jgi:hypothetical protein